MSDPSSRDITGIGLINPSAADWDRFVCAQPRCHLLQQSAWGKLKSQFDWDTQIVALGTGDDIRAGAQVLSKSLPLRLGKMAYVPMGGYAADSAHYPRLWDAIKRETDAAFLKVEPGRLGIGETLDLRGMGFQPSPQTIQPPNTIIIDISAGDETIMQRMNQGTRRKIRKSLASSIDFQEGTRADLADVSRLMLQTGERNEFGVHSAGYFEKVYDLFVPQYGALWLARYEGDLLAAIMVFSLGDTAWYLYGASSRTKSNLNATYGIQWAAIQWAKNRGCRYYDLWGVPDDDEATLETQFKERRDGLWGVYGFKRGWGGEVKRTLGAWDKAWNPLVYAAYRAALRLES